MDLLDLDPRLLRLTYASRASSELSRDDLREIACVAQARNRRAGVTGLLLFVGGDFLQVLEGPPAAVEEIFDSIERDSRNRWVTRLSTERALRRAFEGWSMGCFEMDAIEGEPIFQFNGREARVAPRFTGDFSVFLDQFYARNRRRHRLEAFARAL